MPHDIPVYSQLNIAREATDENNPVIRKQGVGGGYGNAIEGITFSKEEMYFTLELGNEGVQDEEGYVSLGGLKLKLPEDE